jgi:riboflavin synthase
MSKREAVDDSDLFELCKNRTSKHAENVLALISGKESLSSFAGLGRRQGRGDEGPVRL